MGPCVRRDDLVEAVRSYLVGFGAVAAAIGGGLIGDARVMRAIGQARERLAAAEEEFRARGIADRPVAGGLVQFEQRQPLAHRHHIVEGDRIGLHLDLEGVRERGVAARNRTRHPHHLLRRTRLALPRGGRGGALGAAGQAQPVHFADHRISRHISEFRGDLARRQSGFPELLQLLDAIIGPGQYRHRILPFASRRPIRGSAGDVIRLKNPCGQNPLALAGRENRARTCTPVQNGLKGSELPHEMSYPTAQTLQYGVTRAQESGPARPHVPNIYALQCVFSTTPQSYGFSPSCSAGKAASWRVDSAPRPHRIPVTCRP